MPSEDGFPPLTDLTAICKDAECGHTRDLHGPYPQNPCRVKGCPCIRGWAFRTAKYDGPDKTVQPPGKPIR